MLRIGVCDDDKEFLQRLVQMIRIWSDHSGIPTELYPFDNGDELISKNAAFRMDTSLSTSTVILQAVLKLNSRFILVAKLSALILPLWIRIV